ncbi:MAG: hypothetical protein ACRD2E_13410, partial [Terriglobales bacterium]
REDFETVMAAFLDYQNLQEIYWQTLAEHETALAQLRAVTGNWLARRPAGPAAAPALRRLDAPQRAAGRTR